MNYYEKHIGDFIKDTVSLSMMEDGAYNRLIDQCYQSERPLPLDRKEVYREARAISAGERKAVDYVMGKFFDETPEGFVQKRIVAEIARYQDKQRKAKASADARWNKEKPLSDGNANASNSHDADGMRSHSDGNAHQTPDPSNQSPDSTHEEPGGSLSTSGKSPKVAGLQKLIDDIEGKGGAYKPPPCPHEKVLELWKALLPALPQHTVWTTKRSKHLQSRWRETAVAEKWTSIEDGLHYFSRLFRWVGTSKFLTGKSNPAQGRTAFVIELEWLINPSNWAKVIEGKYHTEG